MDSIKLTKLQKKEMKKVFGGQEVTCICSPCASCYCGEGDTIPAQTRNTPQNGELVGNYNSSYQKAVTPVQPPVPAQ